MAQYIAAEDISEDDHLEREKLRESYVSLRLHQGILPERLAVEHGFNRTLVSQFEMRSNWQVRTAQRHARMLDAQLLLEPRDLPLSLEPDDMSEMLRLMHPRSAERRDDIHFAVVKNYLIRARMCIGLSTGDVAEVISRRRDSVQAWERSLDPTDMVFVIQRYARAIGGSLSLRLDPKPKAVK